MQRSKLLRPFPTFRQWRQAARPLVYSLIAGCVGGLIFHQNLLGLLGWIGLVPLFLALYRLEGKTLAWCSVFFGFTWYYLSCFWLHTLVVFHWLIPVGVVAGSFYLGLYFLLFTFPATWCLRNLRPVAQPWALAICWTAVEFLRSFTDMAFPWNLLGHSQFPFNELVMSFAAVGGIYLISFLMVLCNATLAVCLFNRRSRRPWRIAVMPLLLLIAAPILFGKLVVGDEAYLDTKSFKVSVIQPGISQVIRWVAMMGEPDDTPQSYMQRYQQADNQMQERADMLIRKAGEDKPDLIVLPESPFLSSYFPYQATLHSGLWNLARATSATIFLGADNTMERVAYDELVSKGKRFLKPEDHPTSITLPVMKTRMSDSGTTELVIDQQQTRVNLVSAWQITPEHGLEPYVYNKMQLVPFGESLPFVSGISWLKNKLEAGGIAGAFRPGMENTIFETNGARYGAVICFESTFSYLTRNLAKAGAQFICVLTNDAWYDPSYAIEQGGFWGTLFRLPGFHQLASAGPGQHLIQSQLRAIETGLPVVRSANTGISTEFDAYGRSSQVLGYGEAGHLTANTTLKNKPQQTIFTRYGEWVGLLCTGLWAAIILSAGLLQRTRHK